MKSIFWVKQLNNLLANAKKRLEDSRPKFLAEVKQSIKEIKQKYQKIQHEIN